MNHFKKGDVPDIFGVILLILIIVIFGIVAATYISDWISKSDCQKRIEFAIDNLIQKAKTADITKGSWSEKIEVGKCVEYITASDTANCMSKTLGTTLCVKYRGKQEPQAITTGVTFSIPSEYTDYKIIPRDKLYTVIVSPNRIDFQ